ncbi:MAG: DUF362 domain-containing protein [Acidobacteria bacterium]|nr:DUF362 domain-containing protein [Acidobacteriota bacterium]
MSRHSLSRREFLGGTIGLGLLGPTIGKVLAGTDPARPTSYPIRKRAPNPFVKSGKPIVLVVRGTDFPSMLARGMELLGGFARFGTGRSVIVKPNFVFDKRTTYPVTTDEASVLATVKYLQREGFRDITVADRRGKKVNGRAGGKFEWSGLNDRAEAGGFRTDSLLDDEKADSIPVRNASWDQMQSYGVIRTIYEAGLIINLPTLKQHSITNLTCSLKNMMGVLDVPTTEEMHLWGEGDKARSESMSRAQVNQRLAMAIAEAAMAVSPELTVIDARTVLAKSHEGLTEGVPRRADRLIISGDPVAADVVAARVMKEVYEPYDLGDTRHTFQHAEKLGLGVAEVDRLEIIETSVPDSK